MLRCFRRSLHTIIVIALMGLTWHPLLAAESAPPASDTAAIPADNPYAAAIAAWNALSSEERQRLYSTPPGTPVPDSTSSPVFRTITDALRAGAQTSSVDWGIDLSQDPNTLMLSHLGPMRQIALAGLAQADHLLATNPQAAVALVADVTALGRHVGGDNFLISLLTQTAIAQRAEDWMGANLAQLPAGAVAELQRRLAAMPGGGDWTGSLEREKLFPRFLLDKILDVASLSPLADSDLTARKLRMAGLINEGQTVSISIETAEGSFWIQPGRTRNGIRLLSVDLKRRQALLSYENRLVQLQLAERKFVDLDAISISATLRSLPDNHPLRTFFDVPAGVDPAADPESASLDTVGQWISMIEELMDYYDAVSPNFATFDFADTEACYENLSENTRRLAMNMVPLQRTAARARIRQVALDAALSAAATGQSPPADILDPVTQTPFRIIPTPGGYIMESSFRYPPDNRPVRLVVGPDPDES